jgi:rubrerythrin
MVGEALAGLSAIKTAFDIAKGLKDIDNATSRNAAVIELQEKILAAREAQSALLDRVGTLEKEVARFETWEREKQRYELKSLGWGAFARMLKKTERGTEPPHWICTNCYEHGHIATLQHGHLKKGEGLTWFCPACKNTIYPSYSTIKWIDDDAPQT